MKTIYKYKLSPDFQQLLKVPYGATPLHAGLDCDNCPCVWFLVDKDVGAVQKVLIAVVFTGSDIPDGNIQHIGTFTRGRIVAHIFLVLPPS